MPTKIAWCVNPDGSPGETWNPILGCSPVSAGCAHCYAARLASTRLAEVPAYKGLARDGKWVAPPRFLPERMDQPLRRRKPTGWFVCDMSDLFQEGICDEVIAAVFGVMAACPQHRFYVLTKRVDRMRVLLSTVEFQADVERFACIAEEGRIAEFFSAERTVPISGWPGYFITSRGRVLSDRATLGERHEMKPMSGETGHSRVMLYRGDETSRPLIHRLVLEAFDGPANSTEECRHLDGNATNNALWNLRWGTRVENWSDRKRHGHGQSHSKLSEGEVEKIRARCAAGESAYSVARDFCISDTQARNIASGRQWADRERMEWPIPSVWCGVSVEHQEAAAERIPDLLATPVALDGVRFVSVEPMLAKVDLRAWMPPDPPCTVCGKTRRQGCSPDDHLRCVKIGDWGDPDKQIDWVIVGAESGPSARPCDQEWVVSVVDQCEEAGVPVFVKQLHVCGRLSHEPAEWGSSVRVRQFPEVKR